jgi:hypothetical protein
VDQCGRIYGQRWAIGDEDYHDRVSRLVGLGALTVIASLASAAGIVFSRRTVLVLLAGGVLAALIRAAITGLYDVVRCLHFLLATAMRQSRQPIAGERQENRNDSEYAQPSHGEEP